MLLGMKLLLELLLFVFIIRFFYHCKRSSCFPSFVLFLFNKQESKGFLLEEGSNSWVRRIDFRERSLQRHLYPVNRSSARDISICLVH